MHELNLPLPPSLNNYYGYHCKFNYATVYIKSSGKEYRKLVLDYIISNNLQLRANVALEVKINFTPKSFRKQDVDNITKCVLDALTKAEVWDDDSLVYKLTIEKLPPSKTDNGLKIEISQYIS